MALSDAVLTIVEQMEADAKDPEIKGTEAELWALIRGYGRQLRTAVKAAEGATPASPLSSPLLNPLIMGSMAGAQNQAMIEKAKAELRENKRKATENLAEMGLGEDGQSTVRLVGGPHEGTFINCPAEVPAGFKTAIDGAIYIMGADRKAHFSEEETKKQSGVK